MNFASRALLAIGLAGSLALISLSCDVDADLPPGWGDASILPVEQSACGHSETGKGTLMLARDMWQLRGRYENAQFRCDQAVCAWRLDAGGFVRVLAQPCDMNPTMVPRCECRYQMSFPLDHVGAGTTVELYRRWDRYGSTEEPEPVLVGSEQAP